MEQPIEIKKTVLNQDINADRRAILCKLGRFGAYTAPVLLAALDAEKAVACSAPQCV